MLLVLYGLPAAGKTTLAEGVKSCVDECNANILPMFCPFRACVHVVFDNVIGHDFHSVRERAKQAIENALDGNHRTLVICDDNNFYKSMRKEFRHMAHKLFVRYLEVFVDVDVELAVSRNALRPSTRLIPVTEDTIRNMYARFDFPKYGLRIDGAGAVQSNARLVYQACQQQRTTTTTPTTINEPDQQELQRRQHVRAAVLQAKANGLTGKQLNMIANNHTIIIL